MNRVLFYLPFLFFLFPNLGFGQCLNSPNGRYPAEDLSIIGCDGSFTIFAADCKDGQYTRVIVAKDFKYTFVSSIPTDFITITDTTGANAFAFGLSPVVWKATQTTVVRFYTHKDEDCAVDTISKTRSASCSIPSFCEAPSGLQSNVTSNTTMNISWSGAVGSSGYIYEVRTSGLAGSGTPGLEKIDTVLPTVTNVTIEGLRPGTAYGVYVRSICGTDLSDFAPANFPTTTGIPPNLVPEFSHIVVVIGENMSASSVYGSPNAPYINTLANEGAKFTNSFALAHPSQPNYIGLFSGNNQGIIDNNKPAKKFTTPNLASELIDSGKTFVTYAEGLPSVGYNGIVYGRYVRRHNPITNWMGVDVNQISPVLDLPFRDFPSDFESLPSVAFVIPDLCGDGHDSCPPFYNSIKQYDHWIEKNLNAYKEWCIDHNSLLIVTYDEDEFTAINKIATIFYGAHVKPGKYTSSINHYNVLRTIEDAFKLTAHAGAAASSAAIDFCWENSTIIDPESTEDVSNFSVYPNPFSGKLNLNFTLHNQAPLMLEIYDILGEKVYSSGNVFMGIQSIGPHIIPIESYQLPAKSGIYILSLIVNGKTYQARVCRIN